jgi:hypothetical protein
MTCVQWVLLPSLAIRRTLLQPLPAIDCRQHGKHWSGHTQLGQGLRGSRARRERCLRNSDTQSRVLSAAAPPLLPATPPRSRAPPRPAHPDEGGVQGLGRCRRPATPLMPGAPRIHRADDASGRGPVGLRQRGVEFSRCLAAGAWHTSMPTKNSTKFGKIVTEICRFSGRRTRQPANLFFSRGDFFVRFFLGGQAIIRPGAFPRRRPRRIARHPPPTRVAGAFH